MTIDVYRPTLAMLKDDAPLTEAEKKLIAGRKTGEMVVLGGGVPDEATAQNSIRAGLIRYLLLGGCDEVRPHPKGVQLQGAWISDVLDLEGCKSSLQLGVVGSRFEQAPVLQDCELGQLWLDGSHLPGSEAQRMRVTRSVMLRNGFSAAGLVDLNSSVIKGQLDCTGGSFDGAGGAALMGYGLEVGGDVFLRGDFSAAGLVDLNGSVIKGQLACEGGSFDGDLRLQDVQVTGPFFWRDVPGKTGWLDLTSASVGQLVDDAPSWQRVGRYDIDGFQYGALSGALDVAVRLDWLGRAWNANIQTSALGDWHVPEGVADTDPQPYSQLARTLDGVGQRAGAARVRFAREKALRRAEYYRARAAMRARGAKIWPMVLADLKRPLNGFYGLGFGYGHAPMRALLASALIVLFAALFFGLTYDAGQMAPNSDVVLTSGEWLAAVKYGCPAVQTDGCTMPLRLWEAGKAYQDYETFSAFGYGFDLFIPLDALGQEAAWAPSYGRGAWGAVGYWLRWLVQVLGWVITAVAAATLAGLVGRRD